MTLVNFINLTLPLINIPYLISTLGARGYGELAYHQYLGQFALVIFEFGFPLYAVSEVARLADDRKALGRFIADAYLIKLAVLAAASFGIGLIAWLVQLLGLAQLSIPLLCFFVLAAALNSFAPLWFFQGLDAPQKNVLPTLIARLVTLASTFLIVRSSGDVFLAGVPFVLGASVMMLGSGHLMLRRAEFDGVSRGTELRKIYKESLQVFWSRLIIMGYVTVSPLLINVAAGPQGVAVYALCEKAITVARMPFDMFAASAFAQFSRSYDAAQARRFLVPLGIGGFFVAAVIWIIAPSLTSLVHVSGLQSLQSYLPFYALALIPISMHGFLGTCSLLANGKRLELAISIAVGLGFYATGLISLWYLVPNKIILSIAGMILVELGIFVTRLFFVIRYRLI
jgi:polysaccharide transporter, PST family